MSEPSIFLVFLAGVLTIATPCVIPILPPMLAGSVGHRLRPLLIVLGSAVTFTFMGGLFSAIGLAASGFIDYLRFIFIAAIIGFGAVMVDEGIDEIYTKYSSRLVNIFFRSGISRGSKNSLFGAFVLGMSLGIVWIPCVGPILGSVLAYAAVQGNLLKGSVLLLVYSTGLGLPMLAIAYGGKYTAGKVEWVNRNSVLIRKIAGWILILAGAAMLFGIDRYVQKLLLPYAPPIL
ncbi:MAG: cytochrome c biogenesis CcdA family protein [Candidatus Hydrothermarchaeota archaeon]|nr:cytochrome c biogenesis CcdA family protein [Candidatus Hydrothermarchaeota archaeon]